MFGVVIGFLRFLRLNKVVVNVVFDLVDVRLDIEEGEEESIVEDVDVDIISEWELDFCLWLILDGWGKKLWEFVVCDSRW